MKKSLKKLQEKIGYQFRDDSLLQLALTHSSYANEIRDRKAEYNERLEFLGDSVLGVIISEYVYLNNKDFKEGELTKMRSKIVCEPTLAECAREIDLGEYMLFGKGEELTGGRTRRSILADAFEALIAAMYLDSGFDVVKPIIFKLMNDKIKMAEAGLIVDDYKTHLQEIIQIKKENKIKYELIGEKGPDHSKTFQTAVKLNNIVIGSGEGRSKKESEQEAAKMALRSGKLETF